MRSRDRYVGTAAWLFVSTCGELNCCEQELFVFTAMDLFELMSSCDSMVQQLAFPDTVAVCRLDVFLQKVDTGKDSIQMNVRNWAI